MKPLLSNEFFILFSRLFLAFEIISQQSNLNLTVPITVDTRHVFDKAPLFKLDILDAHASPNSTLVSFTTNKTLNFLQLNESTGELWLKESNIVLKEILYVNDLTIKATKSDDDSETRTVVNLQIIPYDTLKDFCEHFMCFYNSITFHVLEDFNDTFKVHDVGEVAPRIYRRICNRKYHAEYTLLNGETYCIYLYIY